MKIRGLVLVLVGLLCLSVPPSSFGVGEAFAAPNTKRKIKKKVSPPAKKKATHSVQTESLGSEAPTPSSQSIPPAPFPSQTSVASEPAPSDRSSYTPSRSFNIALSYAAPTPIYADSQTFYGGWGVLGEGFLPLFSENGLSAHFSLGQQTFSVRTLSAVKLRQIEVMGGIELLSPEKVAFLKPFIGGDLGMAYNWLSFGVSDAHQNDSQAFAFRVRPGFLLPFTDSFAAQLTLPFTGYVAKGSLYTISALFGLRMAL